MALPWINRLGSERGAAFSVGGNRWSTGMRLRCLIEKCRSGEIELETIGSITEKEESSEGRSPERSELREALEGLGIKSS